jgi:predicted nicotinamide N-methyase
MPSTDPNDDTVPIMTETDVVEEDWSQFMTNDLSAGSFAHHDTCDIDLPNGTSLQIASTASLSPLDMMDLSLGTHDATGHCIWMGAHLWIQALPALESYFSAGPGVCRCLELGSGTGLAGIAVFKYYGSSTVFELALTDNSESALKLCRLNCTKNGLYDNDDNDQLQSLQVELLEWGNTLVSGAAASVFDVVMATDVIYDIAAWKPLLETARKSLPNGGHLLVSHVPRAALPNEVVEGSSTIEQSYHKTLESYMIRTAKEHGFLLKVSLKPNDLQPFEKQQDMEDAGASILVFQTCCSSTNDLSIDGVIKHHGVLDR